MMLTKWVTPSPDAHRVEQLRQATGYAGFVCETLCGRGIDTKEKIAALTAPIGPRALQDPMSFRGMAEAADRILGAVRLGEKVCVYGDYDCDGVTSTALLVSCLRELGADVSFYIPNRFTEGYGMNTEAVGKLHRAGVDLIVTVDNGISAAAEVDYALRLGMDVVVTDHHSVPAGPLPRVPTVNPHLPGCPSAFKDITGVGVAFYLACALLGKPPFELLEVYGDIVALGSIADVMPLVEDNRIFAVKGIELLRSADKRPAMKALMEVAGAGEQSVSSRTFGFSLGPRVNAAGRMGDATAAVHMMLSGDCGFALAEAKKLDDLNTERKKAEGDIMKEIDAALALSPQLLQRRVVVVSGEGWHQGVIGIVAARLVERCGKPCIVFTEAGGIARGSGRSIPGVSLIEAITACGEHLVRFGGHRQAAGLTAEADKLEAFTAAMDRFCVARYPVMPVPCVAIDAELAVEDLNTANAKALSVLEPFGEQNPVPQFVVSGATVADCDSLSGGKHTKVHFRKGQKTFSAMYFQMAPGDFPYRENDLVDVLVQLEAGEYRGAERLSVFIRGIRPHGFDAGAVLEDFEAYNRHLRGMYGESCGREALLPTREDIAAVFRFVRERGMTPTPPELAFTALAGLSYRKARIIFDVMTELGFVVARGGNYLPGDMSTKRNLDDSKVLAALSKGMEDV